MSATSDGGHQSPSARPGERNPRGEAAAPAAAGFADAASSDGGNRSGDDPGGPVWGRAWFQALVEHSSDIVVVLGADGSIHYASPSASHRLGYAFSDWAGRNAFGAVHPADRDAVRHGFAELVSRSGSQVPLTFRLVRADGSLLEAEAVATNRLDDPAVGGVVINIRDIGERKRAERQARAADERYRTLVSSLAEGVLLADARAVVVLCNEALETMFGVPARWLIGRAVPDVVDEATADGVVVVDQHGQPAPVATHPLMVALREGRPVTGARQGIVRPGRPTLWMRINARPVLADDGTVSGVVASFADVSVERATTAQLQSALTALGRERQFLQVLLDNLEEAIVACDEEGRITILNPAGRRFFGVPDGVDPIGQPLTLTGMAHLDGTPMAPSESPLARALAGAVVREHHLLVVRPDGVQRTVLANAQALHDDDGRQLGAVVALHDVTEQKRTEARLAELALHDPLTGVANRLLLDDRLRRALAGLRRGAGGVGVFLLDLDAFKAVNDTYGHDVGDEVLQAVAQRLVATVRPQDTVARLGGDEFVVLCEVSGGEAEVQAIAERIERALAAPYQLAEVTLTVGASVGGVLVDSPNREPSKILSEADDAMYRAKAARRGPAAGS
jgi:diguanylate cyclase (GGDEF)-like protein/PAS domain S-box-containing protein